MSVVELGAPLEKVVTLRYNDYGVKQYGTAIVTRPDNFISSIDDARINASIKEIQTAYKIEGDMPIDSVFTKAFLPPQAERMPPALGSSS
jgi:hypothetical protein